MIFKCTAFFRNGDRGWSETYWHDDADYAAAQTSFNALMVKRLAIMPPDCFNTFRRISNPDTLRDSALLRVPFADSAGTFSTGTGNDVTNQADDALLFSLAAAANKKNRIFLRGIPDGVIASNSRLVNAAWDPLCDTAAGSFFQTLITGVWQWHKVAGHPPVHTFAPLVTFQYLGVTTRHTGRPFGLRVGRRAA